MHLCMHEQGTQGRISIYLIICLPESVRGEWQPRHLLNPIKGLFGFLHSMNRFGRVIHYIYIFFKIILRKCSSKCTTVFRHYA